MEDASNVTSGQDNDNAISRQPGTISNARTYTVAHFSLIFFFVLPAAKSHSLRLLYPNRGVQTSTQDTTTMAEVHRFGILPTRFAGPDGEK